MFSRRDILFIFVLLPRLLAHGADASDALDHYNARLDAIARSYKEQFAEIRKNQHRIGSAKADFRAGEQQIQELGKMRTKAIAEAKRLYQKELQQTDTAPTPRLSGEQRQTQHMAARRQAFEDGQRAFWDNVAREESKISTAWAARVQAFEEGQTAFWSEVFDSRKTNPQETTPAASSTGQAALEKQTDPRLMAQPTYGPALAAAR